MTQITAKDNTSYKTLTLILYVLYITAIFTAGILAFVALIINYAKRDEVQGTIYASHFKWQIHSFWWYLAWNIIAFIPFIFLTFTGDNSNAVAGVMIFATIFCLATIGISWLWIIYRAVRGLIALNDDQPIPWPFHDRRGRD